MVAMQREALRFCMVGSGGFIIDAGILQIFNGLVGMDPYGSLNYLTYAWYVSQFALVHRYLFLGVAAGSTIGLLVNYTASKYLVFRLAAKKSGEG